MQSPELLGAIETALVQHPAFGDSTYIFDQLQVSYKRQLTKISARLSVAGDLLAALEEAHPDTSYRVIGNTVVRCAIQHAHTRVESDTDYGLSLEECEKILAAALDHLQSGKSGTPLENDSIHLPRLGQESYHGWVWDEQYPDNIYGKSLRYIIKENYSDSLCTPTSDELAKLAQGEQLLRELLPSITSSALSHVQLIGCFPDTGYWKGKASSSQFRLGGTIFLSRQLLQCPWWVAEHLLHESLHHKLYDFRRGHSMLEPTFSEENAPRVPSLWNAESFDKANHWNTHRTFAAFHVYVHLALLALLAEQRESELTPAYGSKYGMIESRTALERAHYLAEKLKELCWDELGLAGKRMVEWLTTVLQYLDPSSPPEGATLHLLLNLYQREMNEMDPSLYEDERSRATLSRKLQPLAQEEIESARQILAAINAGEDIRNFNTLIAQFGESELGVKYQEVRLGIAKTLLHASPDGYTLPPASNGSADPDTLVKKMVDTASRGLSLVKNDIPLSVFYAKVRAHELQFAMSCDDLVGRLLATLAAAVPEGGRILEIGTGVGVGIGWMCEGLRQRKDVEIDTLEVDQKLTDATKKWPWPEYVKIITGDALDALTTVGKFNLVFADASPIKYQNIDSILKTLKPGGMLVVDDYLLGPKAQEIRRAHIHELRHTLMNNPQLQVLELKWSTGVIIATYCGS